MELEEAEDDEWTTIQYLSESNANSGGKVNSVFNRGLKLGNKILVAGFVVSSAPLVLPPLVVASAIGFAVSMPYAFFLASHACTQNLMSKLLPRPTPRGPLLLEKVCFQSDIDITNINKEEPTLEDETKKDIEMIDVQYMKNEKNLTSENDYGQGVVMEEVEPELSHSQDANDVIEHNGSKEDSSCYFCEEEDKESPQQHGNVKLGAKIDGGLEGHLEGKSNGEQEQPMSGDHGVVTIIEGLDEIDNNEIEESKTPFGVTTVVLEECQDQVKEGDMEEAELQRETKGLSEEMRDEGKTDRRGEYAKGIHGGTNESDQKIGPVVEDMEVALEDKLNLGVEGDSGNEEDPKVCEEMLQSRNVDNKDTICIEVESGEPVRGFLEGKEVHDTNDSEKPMAEPSELLDGRSFQHEMIPAEPIGDLLIEETKVYDIPLAEDSSEDTSEKTDPNKFFEVEQKPLPDGPTILQKGEIDNDISDFADHESQLHEYNETMDSSDADAREIADERERHLCDENRIDPDVYSYTIDLQEESSNVMVDGHTDSMEVLVSSVEQESNISECSSGRNITGPSQEVVFNEESIWKEIHVIRKIIGYEGTIQASCADELKALYIFTGVEPPTFLNNSCDPSEINDNLHFLMSIVGIKSNVA